MNQFFKLINPSIRNKINKKYIFILLVALLFAYSSCFSQEKILYKQISTTKLFMESYFPEKMDKTQKYPAMVFFLEEVGLKAI